LPPWEKYGATPQPDAGPWSKYAAAPPAAPDEPAPPASLSDLVPKNASEWGDAALSFLKGAVANPVKGIAEHVIRVAQGPQTPQEWAAFGALGPLGPQILELARSQAAAAEKSGQAAKEGRYSEAAGYGAAALLPGVGPMAAGIGEKIGDLQIAEGLGEIASPVVLGAAAKGAGAAASRVAAPVRTAAANPAVRAAAGKVASHIPGSGMARDFAGFVRSVSEALKKSKAAPEQVPPASGPVYDAQFTVQPETAPPALAAGTPPRLLERGAIPMGPVTEPPPRVPLQIEAPAPATPPVSVPTKTGSKRAPRKSAPAKKVQNPDDAGNPLPARTEAEIDAEWRAGNRAFWSTPPERSAAAPKPTVESLSAGINEALKADPGPVRPTKPQFPSKVYADSARSTKATKLAESLHEAGISMEDARLMKQEHWEMAAKGAGVKIPSLDTIQRALFELRRLEKAKK
jgi:hypothetical protein